MLDALAIIAPVFAIVALGYGASARGFLPRAAVDGIERFVFNLAIPALLFGTIRAVDIPELLPLRLWGAYYGAIFLVWLIAFPATRLVLRRSRKQAVVFAFGGGFSNSVLLGIPIILTALGDAAAAPLFLILSIHGLTLFTCASLGSEIAQSWHGANLKAALREGVRSVSHNPVIIALAAGLVYGQLELPWPEPLARGVSLLGQAGIPTALFVMGAMLTRYRIGRAIVPALAICVFKLCLHPALVFLLGAYVFNLAPLPLATATILAALPCGIYTFILANQHKTAIHIASAAIILSTLLSLLTLPIVISFLATP